MAQVRETGMLLKMCSLKNILLLQQQQFFSKLEGKNTLTNHEALQVVKLPSYIRFGFVISWTHYEGY